MLKIYNSKTSQKETFVPKHEGIVNMYVCGPTVYNDIHIGNSRPIIVFDVVKRVFDYLGYEVKFVSNITDVDDKIINKAISENVTEDVIATKYTMAYYDILEQLNVDKEIIRPKVTDNMDEIIDFIKKMVDKEYAYEINGDVYFRVSKLNKYGDLSNQNIEDLQVGARIESNTQKENPLDFSLWKKTDVGIKWDSPWGMGRPGWHTECVVLIDKYFGEEIDIHGGGMDLKFPHHENEVAQSRAVNNHDLAKLWMHNGFLNLNNEKMSKSLGNVMTAKEILDNYSANAVKLAMHKTHYRQPINFTIDLIDETTKMNDKIAQAYKQASVKLQLENIKLVSPNIDNFIEMLEDDFNTSNAITVLLDELKAVNTSLRSNDLEKLNQSFANLTQMTYILGLYYDEVNLTEEDKVIYRNWEEARKNKDFDLADQYRTQLAKKNIV